MEMKKNMRNIKKLKNVKFGQLRHCFTRDTKVEIRMDYGCQRLDNAEFDRIEDVPEIYDECNVLWVLSIADRKRKVPKSLLREEDKDIYENDISDRGICFWLSDESKWKKRSFFGLPFTNAEHPMTSGEAVWFYGFAGRNVYFRIRSSDHLMIGDGKICGKNIFDMGDVEQYLERDVAFQEGEEYIIVISKICEPGWMGMMNSPELYARYMAATGMSFDEVWEECYDYYERGCNLNGGLLVRDGQVTWLEPEEAAMVFNEFDRKYYTVDDREKLFENHPIEDIYKIRTREKLREEVEKIKVKYTLGNAPKMEQGLFMVSESARCLLGRKLVEKDFQKTYGEELLIIEARDDWNAEQYMRALETEHKAYLLQDFQGYWNWDLCCKLAETAKKKAVFICDNTNDTFDISYDKPEGGYVSLIEEHFYARTDSWDITESDLLLYDTLSRIKEEFERLMKERKEKSDEEE